MAFKDEYETKQKTCCEKNGGAIAYENMIKRSKNGQNVMKRRNKGLYIGVGDYMFVVPRIQNTIRHKAIRHFQVRKIGPLEIIKK
jgi:hypothetical protein